MGTSPIAVPRNVPLGEPVCPDPKWSAGRNLVLQGPTTFLGARYVLVAGAGGAAPSPAPPIPPIPTPPAVEGSVPFIDVTGAAYTLDAVPDEPEGSTVFVDEL